MTNSKLRATLADLIRINSVNPAYEGGRPESEIQGYVAQFLQSHGIETKIEDVEPGRPNVVGRVPGSAARRLVFEAHCDTVGTEGMTIPPFEPEVRAGRIYGRGSCDTKAGLAAMLCALAETRKSGGQAAEILLASTMDEEHTYRGVVHLCQGLQADGAVVAEPTSLRMVVASKGCLRWRTIVRGRAAHSSKPHLGVNAIYGAMRLVERIVDSTGGLAAAPHPLLGAPTLCVSRIHGGTQINVVPETCWFEIDRRLIPGEEPDAVLAAYQEVVHRACAETPGIEVEVQAPYLMDQPLETPAGSHAARCLAEILGGMGLDPQPHGVEYGSDASKLSRAGVPSLIFGPGRIDDAHSAEESVALEEVELCFEACRRLMREFE